MATDSKVLDVIKIYRKTGFVVVIEKTETGERVWSFEPASDISGISLGNLNFAIIEPKLFKFEILEGKRLHVTCPYTLPNTPTLGVYLSRVERGFITL